MPLIKDETKTNDSEEDPKDQDATVPGSSAPDEDATVAGSPAPEGHVTVASSTVTYVEQPAGRAPDAEAQWFGDDQVRKDSAAVWNVLKQSTRTRTEASSETMRTVGKAQCVLSRWTKARS